MTRISLALLGLLLASPAGAQTMRDIQLAGGQSTLWGAILNPTSAVIDQYNTTSPTAGPNGFRWWQGFVGNQTLLLDLNPQGAVFGTATGGYKGAGTINAAGLYVNGSAVGGGSPGGSSGQVQYNNAGAFGGFTMSGDATLNTGTGALTLATVNSNTGTWGSATLCAAVTLNAKGLVTAAANSACTPAIANVTGLGTGVATWLATPSSANLRAAVTDETGTGLLYFQGGALGTPASGTLTNATGLPLAGLNTQAADTVVANATGGAASPTAVTIGSCSAATSALTYNTSTHVFGCNTIASGGTVTSAGVSNSYGITLGGTNPVTTSGTISTAVALTTATNSLGADVNLSTIGTFFDGPSVAQGSTGTWWAGGTVTVSDTALANISCKLWDGTTTISSSVVTVNNTIQSIGLSGAIASPAGNIRISCKDLNTVNGKIVFNTSGTSKDATVSVVRIQ